MLNSKTSPSLLVALKLATVCQDHVFSQNFHAISMKVLTNLSRLLSYLVLNPNEPSRQFKLTGLSILNHNLSLSLSSSNR